MADSRSWDQIGKAADEQMIVRTVIALSENLDADVSISLRRADEDRYLTISTGTTTAEPTDIAPTEPTP